MTLACVLLVSSGTATAQRAYLLVDRTTGAAEATSSAAIAVDGYSVTSAAGLLNPETWNSLQDQGAEGWTEANPNANQLTELTLVNGGLQPGTNVALGMPFKPGEAALPSQEDLEFKVTIPNADPTVPGSILNGFVVYSGASPTPTITVNRESGAVELTNAGGFAVDGYSIGSASGLLDPSAVIEVPGFTSANPTATLVSGLNWEGAAEFPSTISLGNLFEPDGVVALADEDLTFQYSRPDQVGSFEGVVQYTGAVNDFVLQVNELTGAASIQHMSPNVGALDVTGYSILSSSGGLDQAAWQRLGGDFTEANPRADALAELNLSGSKMFSNGNSHDLGNIFVGSHRDLVFQYSTSDVDLAFGSVQYVLGGGGGPSCEEIAGSRIPGDLDGDGEVAFVDFLVLSEFFGAMNVGYEAGDIDCNGEVAFADFLQLAENFGKTAAAATSVPEPASASLLMLASLLCLSFRRRR